MPGFTVVDEKFSTFNIPLKKLLKYPLRKQTNNVIAVFNRKTGELIDVLELTSKNKRALQKRTNTVLFYGKSSSKITAKKIAKGTTLNINLEKEFIPGDEFILRDQFVLGDQFLLHNTNFKVASKTEKELNIIAL